MPSTSNRQHNFMEMVAHDPAAAKRVGVPQSVGQDFVKADMAKPVKPYAPKAPATRAVKLAGALASWARPHQTPRMIKEPKPPGV
jgi:hypothetical protein